MAEHQIGDCPFCGGMWLCDEGEMETLDMQHTRKAGQDEQFNVVCSCGVQGPMGPSREHAFLRWNNMTGRAIDERDGDWSAGCSNLKPSPALTPDPTPTKEARIPMHDTREKFWMVWRHGSPTTKYRHGSKHDAVAEAERLSRQTPGEVFYVLKTTAAIITDPQPPRHIELVKPEFEIPF